MGGGHTGTIQFKYGTLTTNETGTVMKGEFVLDMNLMESTDLSDAQSAKDLVDHLKSDDFFSVSKFPTASFVITSITPAFKFPEKNEYTVTGALIIKGIKQVISFPALITKQNQELTAKATLTIDRTKWGITYQSKSVFGALQDGIISDILTIHLHLVFDGC